MSVSRENMALLERKLARDLKGSTKVTLTVDGLSRLLTEARREERAKKPVYSGDSVAKLCDVFFNGRPA